MSERRGIERLRWLLENDPDYGEGQYPRWLPRSEKQVMLECTAALIEELHDALDYWQAPHVVIK